MNSRGLGALARKLAEILTRLSARRGTSRFWIVLAIAGFMVGGVLSIHSANLRDTHIEVWPLALVVVLGVPAAALLTAREYHLSTKVAGLTVSFSDALRTSVTATAANLLPLPGGMVVRVAELTRSGSSPLLATGITAAMGVIWIGTAALAAALALLFVANQTAALLFAAAGGLTLTLGWFTFRAGRGGTDLFKATLLVELSSIAVDGVRLWLVFKGLGATFSLAEPIVISLSNVLASAVGVFPGGLGLREALAAALAPLVAVGPALAFLATAVNRLIAIPVQIPLLVFLVAKHRA